MVPPLHRFGIVTQRKTRTKSRSKSRSKSRLSKRSLNNSRISRTSRSRISSRSSSRRSSIVKKKPKKRSKKIKKKSAIENSKSKIPIENLENFKNGYRLNIKSLTKNLLLNILFIDTLGKNLMVWDRKMQKNSEEKVDFLFENLQPQNMFTMKIIFRGERLPLGDSKKIFFKKIF